MPSKKAYNKNLHGLVLSLSDKEAGKIRRQLKKKSEPKTLWKLFHIYHQKDAPEEKKIRSVNDAYSVYQTKLKDFIIDFLHIESESIEKKIASYISKGNLLYFRKQYELAFVELEKGMNLAEYYGHDELQLKLNKLLAKLVNAGKTIIQKSHKSAEVYFEERAQLVENISTAHAIMSTRLKARKIAIQTSASQEGNAKIEEYKTFYLNLEKEKELSPTNRYYWLNCMEMIYRVTGELEKVDAVNRATYDHLQAFSFINENNPLIGSMTLLKLFRSALDKKDLTLAQKQHSQILGLTTSSLKEELYLFEYFPYLEHRFLLLQKVSSVEIYDRFKEYREKYELYYKDLNVESLFNFPNLNSILAIYADKFDEAQQSLEKARREFKKGRGWRQDIFQTFDLHNMAIQFGLGNYGLLPGLAKNAERLFRRENAYGNLQKLLIAFFRDKQISQENTRLDRLKKLKVDLLILEKQDASVTPYFIEHMNWLSWIEMQLQTGSQS